MGMSNAPGTRTISICLSATPWRRNASSAPRISGSTTKSLKRAAMIANRKSRASNSPSIIFGCSFGTSHSSHWLTQEYKRLPLSIIAIHVAGDFQVESSQTLQLFRRAQNAHALQAEILEYLGADAVSSHHGRAAALPRRLGIQQTHAVHEIPRRLFRPQDDHHARLFLGHAMHRRTQGPTE